MEAHCACLCHAQPSDHTLSPRPQSCIDVAAGPGDASVRSLRASSECEGDSFLRLRYLRRVILEGGESNHCTICGCVRQLPRGESTESEASDVLGNGLRLANVLHQGFSSTVCLVQTKGAHFNHRGRAESDMTFDAFRRRKGLKPWRPSLQMEDIEKSEGDHMSVGSEEPDDETTASGQRKSRSYSNLVVKIVHKDRCDAEELNRCERERTILSHIEHPHIIPLLQSFPRPSELVMFFAHAPHGDLHALTENRTSPERFARRITYQLCSALNYLHFNGIVHCDVKPHNILICEPDPVPPTHPPLEIPRASLNHRSMECDWERANVKLGDFGLAQILDPATHKIHFDGVRGSHGYIAPEILQMRDYDEKVDIFALGVVIYTLLVAYEPFYPHSQCIREAVTFEPRYWADISSDCQDFLQQALQGNPELRISSSEALDHPWLIAER